MDSRREATLSIFLFLKPFIALTLLLAFGTMGYMSIEKWDFLDALFMSVTTLTTVGYSTVHPLSLQGVIFTIIYILIGVGLFLYLASEFARYVISANFGKILSKRNMEAKLNKVKNHYIICGYGRTGMEIATQLKNSNFEFIVIDKNPEYESSALESDFLFITGDATDDVILERANISKAKGMFCCLSDDVDNLYLTLSARNLNTQMTIIARCIKASNEQKFKKAGATKIILPYEISGRRMVASVIKPMVVDFLDVVMHTKGQELELKMEQYQLEEGSPLDGKTIIESELRQKTGIIIVAIQRDKKFITNPEPDTILKFKDYLIILGTNQQLSRFEKIAGSKGLKEKY